MTDIGLADGYRHAIACVHLGASPPPEHGMTTTDEELRRYLRMTATFIGPRLTDLLDEIGGSDPFEVLCVLPDDVRGENCTMRPEARECLRQVSRLLLADACRLQEHLRGLRSREPRTYATNSLRRMVEEIPRLRDDWPLSRCDLFHDGVPPKHAVDQLRPYFAGVHELAGLLDYLMPESWRAMPVAVWEDWQDNWLRLLNRCNSILADTRENVPPEGVARTAPAASGAAAATGAQPNAPAEALSGQGDDEFELDAEHFAILDDLIQNSAFGVRSRRKRATIAAGLGRLKNETRLSRQLADLVKAQLVKSGEGGAGGYWILQAGIVAHKTYQSKSNRKSPDAN